MSVENAATRYAGAHRRERKEWRGPEMKQRQWQKAIVKFAARDPARIAAIVLREDFRDLVLREPAVANAFLTAVHNERAQREGR